MRETFAAVPESEKSRCVCYNYEHRIAGERYVLRTDTPPGTPHDPKALLLSLPQLGVRGHDLHSIKGSPPNLYKEIKGDAFAPRNPNALKIDFEHRPPYFEVSPTHKARTWLLDPRAPKVEPPAIIRNIRNIKRGGIDNGERAE